MSVRLYISPIIGNGTPTIDEEAPDPSMTGPFRAKVRGSMLIRTHASDHPDYGKPVFDWALVLCTEPDFAENDSDPTNDRLFGIDLPDSINTRAELRAYLQSRTVGEIPAARRTALQTKLSNRGVNLTGINLASTWWQVLMRVRNRLDDSLGEGL